MTIGLNALILVVALGIATQEGAVGATAPGPAAQTPAAPGRPAPDVPAPGVPTSGLPASGLPAQASTAAIDLPVSLNRIQAALSRPRAFKPSIDRPIFRVEVFGRKPTIADILGPDYLRGPVPMGGRMSHSEFLHMVTPVEFRGMSMFTNGEALTIAATSVGLQWALMKAVDKLKGAKNDRAQEAARREVIEAMNELEAARKKARLPSK